MSNNPYKSLTQDEVNLLRNTLIELRRQISVLTSEAQVLEKILQPYQPAEDTRTAKEWR